MSEFQRLNDELRMGFGRHELDILDDALAALATCEVERDRYREALERIVRIKREAIWGIDPYKVAADALRGES